MKGRIIAAILTVLPLIVIGLGSCGSGSTSILDGSGCDLPWPPTEGTVKVSSDDAIMLTGQDWISRGGDSYNQPYPPNSLYLGDEDDYSWATYSLTGFNETVDFSGLTINCEFRPVGPDDGSELHLGFANYTMDTWEWFTPGDGEYVHDVPDDTDYISPVGSVHFAVIFLSPESNAYASVLSLEIERTGNTEIAPPMGLTAAPEFDSITLTWQEVPTTDGYHVYRDIHKSFAAPEKMTDGSPLIDESFVDDTVERGVMYYYKVSSIRDIFESDLSDYVDTYSPECTRALPVPLPGYSQGPEDYTVKWDWTGQFPGFFNVYYSEESDFNLDSPATVQVTGGVHQAKLDLSGMGNTIYWRVCAYQAGKNGLMTDDIRGETISVWDWTSTEEIGNGIAPISLVKVEGNYSAAYINGTDVDFARRGDGSWDTETALSDDTFGNHIAIAFSGSEYVIATQDNAAHDLYIGTGTPGLWSSSRVHGNNDDGEDHPSSGYSILAASSATEHVVVHYETEGSVMVHTKPVGSGSWSGETDLWGSSNQGDHMSMAELDGNFFLLWINPDVGDLMLSDKDGGWAQTSVLDASFTGVGEFNTLTRFEGEWWTSAFNRAPGERNLHFLNGTTAPWTATLNRHTGHTGEYASMAALDTKLFCIYYRRDAAAWEFALYDEGIWETNWLSLPGVNFTMPVAGGLGDVPYIVYDDVDAGKIMGATGTPPA